jgi:hypothetical protein
MVSVCQPAIDEMLILVAAVSGLALHMASCNAGATKRR